MDLNPQVLCWNVRGLNNPVKRKAVREFVTSTKANLVCFQETKMAVMDEFVVMQCMGPSLDGFVYLSAVETRGGILLAWDTTAVEVLGVFYDTNSLTGRVVTRLGRKWWITIVYGPQRDDEKISFLEELSLRRLTCPWPWMLLGDFNMILHASEKNNANLNHNIMNHFRGFVDDHELKELYMHGRLFTRSNEREVPTLTKIDRILVSVDWDLDHPDCLLQALSTSVSDHAPLYLSTSAHFSAKKRFKTKLEGFEDDVREACVCDQSIVDPFARLDELFRNTTRTL